MSDLQNVDEKGVSGPQNVANPLPCNDMQHADAPTLNQ